MSARYIVGDSLTVLRSLPDASVDLVLSSPAFLGLRSYLPTDHPQKQLEMGSEATPGEFIDALLGVVEECRRVLAPHGSICLELGDTYAGSGGGGGDYLPGGLREGQVGFDGSAAAAREHNAAMWRQKNQRPTGGRTQHGNGRDWPQTPGSNWKGERPGWPLDKSLCLVPELLRVAMVYGFNPLTGRETPRWRARNVVRWCRPNPPVGALADKVRPATSDMIVACVGRRRYFDLDAVRGPTTGHSYTEGSERRAGPVEHTHDGAPPLDHWWYDEDTFEQDAWLVSTEPYKGSHYATWPTNLLVRPIEAMCPRRVCTTCGAPSERITKAAEGYADKLGTSWADRSEGRGKASSGARTNHAGQPVGEPHIKAAQYETVGWTDCGHGTWRPGLVLDPFGGSGTTAVVALGHGRDALLIDLDERNADLARERVGMWLTVEHHNATETVA